MQVSNLANNSIDMKIGERTFKVKRLSINDLYTDFENEVKSEFFDNVVDLASRIKDIDQALELQRKSIKDIPKGVELELLAGQKLASTNGIIKTVYKAIKDSNEITFEEVKQLVYNKEHSIQLKNIIDYLAGNDEIEEGSEDSTDSLDSLEKKTQN